MQRPFFDVEMENIQTFPKIDLIDSTVWGPHYWFFLHTIAYNYPDTPNETTKRKYYDFLHNFPLFIPDVEIGNSFARMLDKYPVSPYLCSRCSFMRWVFFLHNKINYTLGKEELTYNESLESYAKQYQPNPLILHERMKTQHKYIVIVIIFCFIAFSLFRLVNI